MTDGVIEIDSECLAVCYFRDSSFFFTSTSFQSEGFETIRGNFSNRDIPLYLHLESLHACPRLFIIMIIFYFTHIAVVAHSMPG